MAFRGSRHRNIVPVHIDPIGGMRLDIPPQALNDMELTSAHNMIYLPNSSVLTTRPALTCLSTTALGAEINNMVHYDNKLYVSGSDSKIYSFNFTTKVFTFVANILAGSVATFLPFNDKLLWADGGSLYEWDGSTVTDLTPSLAPSTCVEILSRVVINDVDDADAVYFSGPEDQTDWDTSAGGAIGIRAGYGDGMAVNALAVLGQDVMVSKTGHGERYLYRINVAGGIPTQWQTIKMASDTSANGPLLFAGIPNDVLYVNEDSELRALSGISEYGDLRAGNVGEKINTLLRDFSIDGYAPSLLKYLPSYDVMACIYSGKIILYHNSKQRFTYIDMLDAGVKLFACCDVDDSPHWAGDSGHIYAFSEAGRKDIPAPGEESDFTSRMKTKRFFIPGDVIVKRLDLSITSIVSGHGLIEVVSVDGRVIMMKEFDLTSSIKLLFDATGEIFLADGDISDGDTEGRVVTTKNKTRVHNFYLQVRTTSGRIGINSLDAQLALVNG